MFLQNKIRNVQIWVSEKTNIFLYVFIVTQYYSTY